MKDTITRNLPALEVIESTTPPAKDKVAAPKEEAAKTVEDISSTATWSDDAEDDLEPLKLAEEDAVDSKRVDELKTIDLDAEDITEAFEPKLMASEKTPAADLNLLDELETVPFKSQPQVEDAETAEFKTSDIDAGAEHDDESLETPEEAAQRIDAWFRSAKTIEEVPSAADMPPIDMSALDEPSEEEEPTREFKSYATNATIDLGTAGIDDELALSDDFELDQSSEAASETVAPWDDSHHIDQLLANIQDQPAEYADELPVAEALVDDAHDAGHRTSDESPEPAADWMPEESLAIKPGSGSQQRSKSIVRTLVLPAVCGVLGLALGYYVLLWIRGPQIDVLDAAKYLPKAMLPASFSHPARQIAAFPALPPVADNTATEPPASEPADASNEATKIADAAKPNEAPAEKPASFTEPADASKIKTADDDRYATTASATNKTTELAAFNAPPAAPASDISPAPSAEPVRVTGAPSFSASDLAAAIVAAKDAEAGLVDGNLSDGHDVARTKGFSYSILADLAQKSTFNDPSAADADKLQQDADNIFHATLATPHARDEVTQIVPKWIASPNRKQGGVFFAGTLAGTNKQGSVVEGNVDLGAGESLPVLLPPALAEKPPAGPVAVIGYIVDKPAERINGYTGTAPQAIFATKLIPLQ